MIPLRIKVEGAYDNAPFVVRLRDASDEAVKLPADVFFCGKNEDSVIYDGIRGKLRLLDVSAIALTGDVLLIDPPRGVAHRLIRAASPHNTLLVTERCDQLCVMCSQPPKEYHSDVFSLLEEAILLAPRDMTIGISGGEPTLYKNELFDFLRRLFAKRSDLRFHVLTNAQHFDAEDERALAALPTDSILWGIPLYASDPDLHDQIVGKVGAFNCLMDSLALLARCGVAIELRTVLLTSNAQALVSLAKFVAIHVPFVALWAIMQLENIGYGRMNWNQLFYDSSLSFAPVGAAVDVARGHGLAVALYNFPLCTIPASYRAYAHASISDWKQRFLPVCEGCKLRKDCGGFFAWYPSARGFAIVGPT